MLVDIVDGFADDEGWSAKGARGSGCYLVDAVSKHGDAPGPLAPDPETVLSSAAARTIITP